MAELTLDEWLKSDENTEKTKPTLSLGQDKESLEGFTKSTVAQAYMPRPAKSQDDLEQEFISNYYNKETSAKPIYNPADLEGQPKEYVPSVADLLKDPNAIAKSIIKNQGSLMSQRADLSNEGYAPLKKNKELWYEHPYVQKVFTALGYGENTVVNLLTSRLRERGILPEKWKFENFTDHTFKNLLIGLGADPEKAGWYALPLSFAGDPLTYATLGIGPTVKMALEIPKAAKGVAITRRGLKQLSAIAEKSKPQIMAKHEKKIQKAHDALVAKGKAKPEIVKLTAKEQDKIMTKVAQEQERLVYNAVNEERRIARAIIKLPKSAIDDTKAILKNRKGIKNRLKGASIIEQGDILFANRVLIPGEYSLWAWHKSGLPKMFDTVGKTPGVPWAKEKVVDPAKEWVGKLFVTDYGVPKPLVRALQTADNLDDIARSGPIKKAYTEAEIDGAKRVAIRNNLAEDLESYKIASERVASKFFEGLNGKQKVLFADTMNNASNITKEGVYITPKKLEQSMFVGKSKYVDVKDAKVQDRLDRWLGQGKYSGMKSIADQFWEQSVKAGLEPPKKLRYWWPGIMDKLDVKHLRFDQPLKPAERNFLKARTGVDPEQYTRNPVKAWTYRQVQIMYANLQDKMYNSLKKENYNFTRPQLITHLTKKDPGLIKRNPKLANPENWTELDFSKAGYLIYKEPKKHFAVKDAIPGKGTTEDIAQSIPSTKKEALFGPKEFVKQWDKTTRKGYYTQGGELDGILGGFERVTGIYKRWLTLPHPAYHAMNFTSNIILNAYHIGGHALNPKRAYYTAMMAFDNKGIVMNTLNKLAKAGDKEAIKDLTGIKKFFSKPLAALMRGAHSLTAGRLDEKVKVYGGIEKSLKEIVEEAKALKVVDGDMLVDDLAGEAMSTAAQVGYHNFLRTYANPLSSKFAPLVVGKNFGTYIETQARLVNFLTHRMQGLSPKMAAKATYEALYDYGDITGFQKALSSFIPFITFSQKNLVNHTRLLANRPGVVANALKFYENLAPNADDLRENYPSWVSRMISIKFGKYAVTGFQMPVEDILSWIPSEQRPFLMRSNPLIRGALELAFDQDLYSGRKLDEIDKADEFRTLYNFAKQDTKGAGVFETKMIEGARKLADALKLREEIDTRPHIPQNKRRYISMDPDWRFWLTMLPTTRHQRLLASFEKDMADEDMTTLKNAVKWSLGFTIIEPDPKLKRGIEYWKTKNKMQAVMLNKRMGDSLRKMSKKKWEKLANIDKGFYCFNRDKSGAGRLMELTCSAWFNDVAAGRPVQFYREHFKKFEKAADEAGKRAQELQFAPEFLTPREEK